MVCQALAKVLVYVLFLCLYYATFNSHSFLRQFARCLLPRVRCHNKIKRKIMVNSDYPALILTQHDIILRARVHVPDAKTGGTSQNAFYRQTDQKHVDVSYCCRVNRMAEVGYLLSAVWSSYSGFSAWPRVNNHARDRCMDVKL